MARAKICHFHIIAFSTTKTSKLTLDHVCCMIHYLYQLLNAHLVEAIRVKVSYFAETLTIFRHFDDYLIMPTSLRSGHCCKEWNSFFSCAIIDIGNDIIINQ